MALAILELALLVDQIFCQGTVKSEYLNLSKNDVLSFQLTTIQRNPANPAAELTPER